jgi:hypothetical protein
MSTSMQDRSESKKGRVGVAPAMSAASPPGQTCSCEVSDIRRLRARALLRADCWTALVGAPAGTTTLSAFPSSLLDRC